MAPGESVPAVGGPWSEVVAGEMVAIPLGCLLPGLCSQSGRSSHRPEEDCEGVAAPNDCEGCTIIPGVCGLKPLVCNRVP